MKFETMAEPKLLAPETLDRTLPPDEQMQRRRLWAGLLREAIREHDAWALLVTRPDGDVALFDVTHDGVWQASDYGSEAVLLRPEPGWDTAVPRVPVSTHVID